MITSSTLVETVSINYEDFTEGFLTCGTCLNTYDNFQHAPKLLVCSHTLCEMCLESICSQPRAVQSGSFRCPICREIIPTPRDGASTFPPAFLVNQLLDLVNRQRREVIPKCSNHLSQELLFCETCDTVFCNLCNNGSHGNVISANCEHTVIPFSIAIKRMSEILLYKAQKCIAKLEEAYENVSSEIRKLDQNADSAFDDINRTFTEIINLVDKRRLEVLSSAKKMREDKREILQNQLRMIENEKARVEAECNGLKYQGDVRNITGKINELSVKTESISSLLDPRENCFMRYENMEESTISVIQEAIKSYGAVRSSKTFPSLCEANVGKCFAKMRTSATIVTYDYSGERQCRGGDPVAATLVALDDDTSTPVRVIDRDDGTYEAQFITPKHGTYHLNVTIFGHPIKTYPVEFEASVHVNPICIYGTRGLGDHSFLQPVTVAISETNGLVYVLDTGNCRIKILSSNDCNNSPFNFERHIEGLPRSVTGMALMPESILVTNFESRQITELDENGVERRHFSHCDLREPTHICVNSRREIIVADNGVPGVFIFYPTGKLLRKLVGTDRKTISTILPTQNNHSNNKTNFLNGPSQTLPPKLGVIGAIAIGQNDEILVASESKIYVYSSDGSTFIREIIPEANNNNVSSKPAAGSYGGLAYDKQGHLLATRTERGRVSVQVFDYTSGQFKLSIDSMDAKLKRASGLAATNDYHVIVVDLGNDCIKKYRYH